MDGVDNIKMDSKRSSFQSENQFIEKPLYAVGKTQAYLLSLVAPTREIILIKPYNQVVEERLLAEIRRTTKRDSTGSYE
ncbi:unnamed protein product [Cylicocyclus nassatus]|uniref:Uncharacterized protein n=1 Tax=Cylicocyclus nassatus TaxID=53992 RepID=A0AA36HCT2_CYLNA|nr:unnamed protein product [Cylicocyclus nassatus]